jgi:DNA helicase HerA-like ATPase
VDGDPTTPQLVPAADNAAGDLLSLLGDLPFARVVTTPREDPGSGESPLRKAVLAGLLDAGVRHQSVACLWARVRPWAPLELLIAGGVRPEPSGDGDPGPLLFPLGARGLPAKSEEVLNMVTGFSAWVPCAGSMDEPFSGGEPASSIRGIAWTSSPFDDIVGYLAHQAFAWLVVSQPVAEADVAAELDEVRREIFRLGQSPDRSETDKVQRQRLEAQFRDLTRAGLGGVWSVRVLVGATDGADARALASILCTAAERSITGYRLRPMTSAVGSISALGAGGSFGEGALSYPFTATVDLVAAVVRPPESELPGVRVVSPPGFDTTLELPGVDRPTVEVGKVLDRHLRPVSDCSVALESLNRHTFVCGATGSGKSQTVRGLLEQVTRRANTDPIHWLVVEPAKTEYARIAGRLRDLADVYVITPGDKSVPPASLNPLEPASLDLGNPDKTFPLQSHAELVGALFDAAFDPLEPIPQILAQAMTACYERAGWDLVTGNPLLRYDHETGQLRGRDSSATSVPRYPTLRDLQQIAEDIIRATPYDPEAKSRVQGMVDVRIRSLRLGTPGRFFEAGHPIDFSALLRSNAVFEIEKVTNDRDKAFVMGTVLIRLYEQLWLEDKERVLLGAGPARLRHMTVIEEAHRLLRGTDPDLPRAHAVELFASLLAEVRAYGEGLVIAEQIPSKIIADAIKNTALKVVHRLPAADDRTAVGATMNLSEAQSQYVVTLQPGDAAVFTDGMDRPVLVRMPLVEKGEDASYAIREAPFRGRRSRACGRECTDARPCTLEQIRGAEHLLDDYPELTLWAEVACAWHLIGLEAPWFTTRAATRLRAAYDANIRLFECAVAHAVERATTSRYQRLKDFFDPDALGEHLAGAVGHSLFPRDRADSCLDDDGRWRAGQARFSDVTKRLKALADQQQSPPEEELDRLRARGFEHTSNTVAELVRELQLMQAPYSDEYQADLLIGPPLARFPGTQAAPLLVAAAAKLSGREPSTDDAEACVASACKGVIAWRRPGEQDHLSRVIGRTTAVHSLPNSPAA